MSARLIIVRPYRGKFWQAFEAPGVHPFYEKREHAIGYARQRGPAVHVVDEQGNIVEQYAAGGGPSVLTGGN